MSAPDYHGPEARDRHGRPYLRCALPKGRLADRIAEHFAERGLHFSFDNRKLVSRDEEHGIEYMLVKNSDLPTYVHHGIAGIGMCGDDVLYESGYPFYELARMPFGSTRMCLASRVDEDQDILPGEGGGEAVRIATKFTRFARDYFHDRGVPVQIIKLNGSVELAPVLGLAPYIVDLVETGSTLKANKLEVKAELAHIHVKLIANPAYYKFHYARLNELLGRIAPDA